MTITSPRYKVRPVVGIKALVAWMANPVSADGPTNLARLNFATGGPAKQRQVAEMRADPDGRRILERRADLGAVLADDSLGDLPEGTLGKTYHTFMSAPEAVPGFMLAALMYRGGDFDRLDWDGDMKYLAERLNNTHDLTHMLSGYGTHLANEALNINFTIGLEGKGGAAASRAWSVISGLVLLPKVGMSRWMQLGQEAFERGARAAATKPFHCIPWEDLLPLPLDEVRRQLGVTPLPEVIDTRDWIRNPLGRAMSNGYGKTGGGDPEEKKRNVVLVKRVIDAGIPMREIVNLGPETHERLLALARAEAPDSELRAAARQQDLASA